jgi:hypothetical protein
LSEDKPQARSKLAGSECRCLKYRKKWVQYRVIAEIKSNNIKMVIKYNAYPSLFELNYQLKLFTQCIAEFQKCINIFYCFDLV